MVGRLRYVEGALFWLPLDSHSRIDACVSSRLTLLGINTITTCLQNCRLVVQALLYLEQDVRLPVVQLHDLVELVHRGSKRLQVAGLNGVDEDVDKLCFARG